MPLKGFDWGNLEANLDVRLTTQQIRSMGYNALWRKGMICPSRIVGKQNHDINCTLCDGIGFLYDREPTNAKVLVTSISVKQMYQTFGRFDAGMAMITTEPANKLSWWDSIEFTQSTARYTEAVQRAKVGVIDRLKYKVIDTVRLVDAKGRDYVKGTDYDITAEGRISWRASGQKPAPEAFYSIAYLVRPTYIVLDLIHVIRDSPSVRVPGSRGLSAAEFPVMGVGKLNFLLGHQEVDAEGP